MIALVKKRNEYVTNFTIKDWLRVRVQVCELSQACGKLGSTHEEGPSPFMHTPALQPLLSAECNPCLVLVDPIMARRCNRSVSYSF